MMCAVRSRGLSFTPPGAEALLHCRINAHCSAEHKDSCIVPSGYSTTEKLGHQFVYMRLPIVNRIDSKQFLPGIASAST